MENIFPPSWSSTWYCLKLQGLGGADPAGSPAWDNVAAQSESHLRLRVPPRSPAAPQPPIRYSRKHCIYLPQHKTTVLFGTQHFGGEQDAASLPHLLHLCGCPSDPAGFPPLRAGCLCSCPGRVFSVSWPNPQPVWQRGGGRNGRSAASVPEHRAHAGACMLRAYVPSCRDGALSNWLMKR